MKRFGSGLVVGKFAPLHRGHELVIRAAREQCEAAIVLSYLKPELPGYEPERRRAWLETQFPDVRVLVVGERDAAAWKTGLELPHNEAPAADHRRFVARVSLEILATPIDAVFTSESYGEPFADALTQYYASRGLRRRPVAHVAVDPARARVPVSGTLIRTAPYEHRHWLSPFVYASMIRRVVMLGGESSGKTTLARALALECRTLHVDEFGRELWHERDGELDAADLLMIAEQQVAREERALPECRELLFCDTSPLTTALYSRVMFGDVAPELERLARREYHLTVYCAPDFPFVQDGTRIGPEFRARQDALTRAELERRRIPHLEARGSIEERVQRVLAALASRKEQG